MVHTLVIPNELEQKLIAAHGDGATHAKWLAIGVDTVEDMLERIKDRLNEKNPKLELIKIRTEDKTIIKEHINNTPIYVVSVCTSNRVNNDSVKQQIICAETMGVNYVDVFNNQLYDIINTGAEDNITRIKSLQELDSLVFQGEQILYI